jgi:hypothetical protein
MALARTFPVDLLSKEERGEWIIIPAFLVFSKFESMLQEEDYGFHVCYLRSRQAGDGRGI